MNEETESLRVIFVATIILTVLSGGVIITATAESEPEPETLEWPIEPSKKPQCYKLEASEWGQCAIRPDCTLVKSRQRKADEPSFTLYSCRPAQGRCEQGFVQAVKWEEEKKGKTPESVCKAKKSCQYVAEGPCWCPPFTIRSCNCAGGSPPMCK